MSEPTGGMGKRSRLVYHRAVLRAGSVEFPEGIGPIGGCQREHEEVLLVPRWVKTKRVTFKYGLGDQFIGVLKTLHMLGLDNKERSMSRVFRCAAPMLWLPACQTRHTWAIGCSVKPAPAPGSRI